jgi:hypothetical protein
VESHRAQNGALIGSLGAAQHENTTLKRDLAEAREEIRLLRLQVSSLSAPKQGTPRSDIASRLVDQKLLLLAFESLPGDFFYDIDKFRQYDGQMSVANQEITSLKQQLVSAKLEAQNFRHELSEMTKKHDKLLQDLTRAYARLNQDKPHDGAGVGGKNKENASPDVLKALELDLSRAQKAKDELAEKVSAIEKIRRRYSIVAKEETDKRIRAELALKAEAELNKQVQRQLFHVS